MKYLKIVILILLITGLYAQDSRFDEDYKYFGRKEVMTMGTVFSTLGTSSFMTNPANIALVTDNRISTGFCASDVGQGFYLAWVAPNFSISNADQRNPANSDANEDFKKKVIQFNFGFSTADFGLTSDQYFIAAGINLKRQTDLIYDANDAKIAGGPAIAYDLGILVKWRVLVLEAALLDINTPEFGDARDTYEQGYLFGARYENENGLKIGLQGLSGDRYMGTDLGLNIGVEQGFFERRLVSRLQLTSYYNGFDAMMQNVSASIGYRFSSKGRMFRPLKDLELNYALSLLTRPNQIGTHMVVFTKYF